MGEAGWFQNNSRLSLKSCFRTNFPWGVLSMDDNLFLLARETRDAPLDILLSGSAISALDGREEGKR